MARRRSRSNRIVAEPQIGLIEDMTHEGNGITRLEGKTVFVAGALTGEKVKYQQVKHGKTYDEADLVEVLEASPDRVEPRCEYFGYCGGCSLQHMEASSQIKYKQKVLVDNLQRIGNVVAEEILEPLTGPSWHYRRKARLGVKDVPKKGRVLVGFREKRAPYIADIKSCQVLESSVGLKLAELSEMIEKLSIKTRLPQIEVAIGDNAVGLVFRVMDEPTEEDLAILREFAATENFAVWLQPKGPETIYPLDDHKTQLYYELPDYDTRVNFLPSDFTQVNPELNKKMVKRAVGMLDVQPGQQVLELFAGLGNFTVPLARQAGADGEVVTVEGDATLVARGEDNAKQNGCTNTTGYVANLYEDCTNEPWYGRKFDRVLIDPPRSGAAEILAMIAASSPEKIVYVSCHPGTLARDAGILVNDHGYKLVQAGAMDMFPHTAHVESIALFEKA
ncbi:MAG: 23S rRNA (uracil1939-C5)-methyltransferase [Gammaproteobacteria bacterium]|jgi:23S rRNA (uracil1939-C5)-methyltransferase